MKFADYIPLAMRTCKPLPFKGHVMHMALGITGEMGEVIDALKKHYIYGKELDQANIVEEISDASWYIAGLASLFPNTDWEKSLPTLYSKDETATLMLTLCINSVFAEEAYRLSQMDESDQHEVERITKRLVNYLYRLAYYLNVDLEQAFEINIQKLAKRYGDKYSDFNATNRDLDAERAILEGKA